mgnify:CR=1 FL=1
MFCAVTLIENESKNTQNQRFSLKIADFEDRFRLDAKADSSYFFVGSQSVGIFLIAWLRNYGRINIADLMKWPKSAIFGPNYEI